jgi:leucyl aminopeptidase
MDIKVKKGPVLSEKSDALIFAVFEDEKPSGALAEMDSILGGVISSSLKSGEFTGKKDETIFYHNTAKTGPSRIILAGLGKRDKFVPDNLMRAAGASASLSRKLGLKDIAVAAGTEGMTDHDFASLWSQGALLALYNFETFKKPDPKKKDLKSLTFMASDRAMESALKKGAAEGKTIAESINFAKDMINTPANEMTPSIMASRAKAAAKDVGLKIKVLEADECRKLGMGSYLGVAKGSKEPPKFIVLEYSGGKRSQKAPYVIVGKGITFDSGGISIKPVEGMEKMKYDMAGAAAVIATIRCAAALKLPLDIVAITPCSENMPGGAALKPGDVVRAINGKTIEIISTDAEGRLVLADALCFAQKYKPAAVIDIATLTGACVIALGDLAIGLMGNNRALIDDVRDSGEAVNERAWELPMWDEFLEAMKGDVTDFKNVGGRKAATITAGKFLQEFVDYPWVHLDIAGTAWEEKGKPYCPKGATGVGVRLLVEFLKRKSV